MMHITLALELPTAISSASHAIATALCSREDEKVKRRCQGLKQSELKALKRTLAQISCEIELLRSSQAEVALYLHVHKIADSLDEVLESEYCLSRSGDISPVFSPGLARYQTLATFAAILAHRPADFEVIEAIRVGVADKLSRLSYLLKEFCDVLDDADPDDLEASHIHESTSQRNFPSPRIAIGAFPDVRSLAENLHDILHKYWPCHQTHHDHSGTLGQCDRANMQLDPQWIIRGSEERRFFMILTGADITQECRIHLSETLAGGGGDDLLCLLRHDECKECCLFLMADTSGQLWENANTVLDLQLHIQSDPRKPAEYKLLSLRQLLQALEPSYAAKRVIGMILARSLLVLLNGPWVGNSLSMDDVFVFCQFEHGEPRPFFDKVFISTRFGKSINTPPVRRPRNAHPFPAIQALGILIAEVELADDLEGIYRDVSPKDKVQKPGQIAMMLCREAQKRLPGGAGVLRAIRFCQERSSLEKYVYRTTSGFLQEDADFVKDYYLNIVRPLEEDLVVGANWSWDEINWNQSRELDDCGIAKIITRPAPGAIVGSRGKKMVNTLPALMEESDHCSTPNLHQQRLQLQSRIDADVVFDAGSCALASDEVSLTTDDWFAELRDVHKNLNRDRMDSLSEEELEDLVKVAVIDTGIDLSHPEFQAVLKSGQLDPGIDLVDQGKTISDEDGHGTHVCHTLLQTAPYAKLYPMRVFRTSTREASTPGLIKQAIFHAIETWDVDIISMSFAFEQEEVAIKEALYHAKSRVSQKNVLMFAAASNNRSLRVEPIGYPARAMDRVICVNSSTVDMKRSSFSPKGIPGQPNLSVVGENVDAAWPLFGAGETQATRRRMSGTSCATPIVAGIAAMTLDFAKKDLPELRCLPKWDVTKGQLWDTYGMRAVLKKCMTDETRDESYSFIKPWRLLKETDVAIAVKIIEALERKYR